MWWKICQTLIREEKGKVFTQRKSQYTVHLSVYMINVQNKC